MNRLAANGIHLAYELDVRAGPQAPLIVLSNSLGTHLGMWQPQLDALARHRRVLRYDTRGHGASDLGPSPETIADLGRDVVGLIDALGVARVDFCGLSMGGLIGQWLGVHAADRIERLVLCNTAAKIGTDLVWNARIAGVLGEGMQSITEAVLERWFTAGFRARAPEAVAAVREGLLATPAAGYAAACTAIRDADLRGDIATIRAPTLIVAGTHDPATTPADGAFLAAQIRGARYVELDCAHLSNIEAADAFNAAVLDFLLENGHG
jgi:3-oxoadipate enol-lactonase